MSGPNQHHIPQFLQRACGVKPKGKRPKEIWVHRLGVEPELCLISKTASDDHFYSEPATSSSKTLDDKITDSETPLAVECAKVRDLEPGAAVEASRAADIVMQLAARSSHIRLSMASAVCDLVTKVGDVFSDTGQVEQLLGLDSDEPSERFLERFREEIKKYPETKILDLPPSVLEQVAFHIIKEQLDNTASEFLPHLTHLANQFDEQAPSLARNAHNEFLEKRHEKDVRRDYLETLFWTVERGPSDGVILPDCVAVAYEEGQSTLPLLYAGKEPDAVIMPISREKLLVGRRDSIATVDLSCFNQDAAACSYEFFLANSDEAPIANLNSLIGTRTQVFFQSAIQSAFEEFLAKKAGPEASAGSNEKASVAPSESDLQFQCQISCEGFSTEDFAYRVADAAKDVITNIAHSLPIARLEAITIAADYPAALAKVNRGRPDLPPAKTISSEIGTGIAKMVIVVRDGMAKGHIVLHAAVGENLVSEETGAKERALNILVHQLTLVAMMEWVERALPGTLLQPLGGGVKGLLFREVDTALHGYVASFISGRYGDPKEIADTHRELLVGALVRFKQNVEGARLAYRYDSDLDKLLSVAMPAAGYVLQFAAELLGSCAASDQAIYDEEGCLKKELERANLLNWLMEFWRDLERFRKHTGAWKSFDDFLFMTRHVQRLLWSVGLFPWESPNGTRFEVPLVFDAAVLMKQEAVG